MRDARLLWRWANDPTARARSFDPTPIPWTDHQVWLDRSLGRHDVLLCIGEEERHPVGLVRFEERDGVVVVSVNVAPEARGRGVGPRLIALGTERALQRWHVPVEATIRSDNAASRRAFEIAGYRFDRDDRVDGVTWVTYVAAPEEGRSRS